MQALPNMVPFKRAANEKSGLPVFQPQQQQQQPGTGGNGGSSSKLVEQQLEQVGVAAQQSQQPLAAAAAATVAASVPASAAAAYQQALLQLQQQQQQPYVPVTCKHLFRSILSQLARFLSIYSSLCSPWCKDNLIQIFLTILEIL